ncbi:MAG: endopeptidase La [Spirochaetes bacterium]|nr:endopeptidase La [Spirochaetota bacterium]
MADDDFKLAHEPEDNKLIDELEKADENFKQKIPEEIGILPLQKLTLFPFQIAPLIIMNQKSLNLIDEVMVRHRIVCVVTQKKENGPYNSSTLYNFGCVCKILRMIKLPNGNIRILVQGVARAEIKEFLSEDPYIKAKIRVKDDIVKHGRELDALKRNIIKEFQKIASHIPQIGEELQIIVSNIEDPSKLADMIATNMNIDTKERQKLLQMLDVKKRIEKILYHLSRELDVLELGSKIQTQVKSGLDKKQREFYLRQEMEAIKKELGESDEVTSEINDLKKKIKAANMPEKVEEVAMKELTRMNNMQPGFAEYTVIRTYIEWLIDLPWSIETKDNLDILRVEKVLDADHYDLEKVKERIIEYLSVRKLKSDMKGPILCFVGPPGVGKTSLGQSIARAMNRKFVRISLGGIRDEAEIRGHRRTYVGALPGRIILSMKNAGSNNPIFMLDEIDKVGADFRGDPASALLEVLDPQQNNQFTDHYLDIPFDLSKVFFITTANILDTIPPALLDRMEILRIPGYTLEEKVNIAKKYLVDRQLKENGIENKKIKFTSSGLKSLIKDYTREAGVRNLEREIGSICRKIARKIAENKKYSHKVDEENVPAFLGPKRFFSETAERIKMPGIATGMAWTSVGGSILFIEASKMKGKGLLQLTGSLGEVMKESASIALSLIKSNDQKLGINFNAFDKTDFHIHVPEGATPKDGPSAGITIFTALYSLLVNKKVKSDYSMTGEITLRGKILPIGGIKEKVLAAKEAGIKNIIMPKLNEKDMEDIPKSIKSYLKFHLVDDIQDVTKIVI